ncbi:MAG: OadG family protein [Bacillota bacterium]
MSYRCKPHSEGGGTVVSTDIMVTLLAAQNIDSLEVTVTGLSVVFLVLGALWLVLELLNLAFRRPEATPPQKEKPAEVAAPAPEPVSVPAVTPREPVAPAVGRVMPAVITAAVVDTLGFIPEQISITRVERGSRPQVIAAVMAAVASHIDIDDLPRLVRIQKVERR